MGGRGKELPVTDGVTSYRPWGAAELQKKLYKRYTLLKPYMDT